MLAPLLPRSVRMKASIRFPRFVGIAAVLTVLSLASTGCGGPTYARGTDVEGLDDPAMSLGLDRRDLEKAVHENLKSLMASPLAHEWSQQRERSLVAIYPFMNQTTQHIDLELDALLSDVETFMVNSQLV